MTDHNADSAQRIVDANTLEELQRMLRIAHEELAMHQQAVARREAWIDQLTDAITQKELDEQKS